MSDNRIRCPTFIILSVLWIVDMWCRNSVRVTFKSIFCRYRSAYQLPVDRQLPYELRALECALSTVIRMLSRECADLENSASAPLERLSHVVSDLTPKTETEGQSLSRRKG